MIPMCSLKDFRIFVNCAHFFGFLGFVCIEVSNCRLKMPSESAFELCEWFSADQESSFRMWRLLKESNEKKRKEKKKMMNEMREEI